MICKLMRKEKNFHSVCEVCDISDGKLQQTLIFVFPYYHHPGIIIYKFNITELQSSFQLHKCEELLPSTQNECLIMPL